MLIVRKRVVYAYPYICVCVCLVVYLSHIWNKNITKFNQFIFSIQSILQSNMWNKQTEQSRLKVFVCLICGKTEVTHANSWFQHNISYQSIVTHHIAFHHHRHTMSFARQRTRFIHHVHIYICRSIAKFQGNLRKFPIKSHFAERCRVCVSETRKHIVVSSNRATQFDSVLDRRTLSVCACVCACVWQFWW